jgi:outer membrane protein
MMPKALVVAAALVLLPGLSAAEKPTRSSASKKPAPKEAARPIAPKPEMREKVSMVKGDLTLERAVALALRQNPDILRAIQEIERTRGQVLEVRAQALPRVDLTTRYFQQDKDLLERRSGDGGGSSIDLSDLGVETGGTGGGGTIDFGSDGSSSGNFGGDKTWRIAIEARQVLYSGGQVGAAIKIAKYTEDQSIFLFRDAVDRVIAQTRSQFYLVLLNRELITVAEQNLQLLNDELKDQTNRFDAGTVPRFNVLRAEVAVANAKPELIRTRNNYLVSQLELAKTLGLEASRSATGKPSFEVSGTLRMTDRKISQQQALAMARERRAFLKAQKQNILNEEQQIVVARAGYKPRIDANTGYEMRNSRLTDNLSKEANGWFFGFDGSWAIFDGFETKGKVQQAHARLASAKILYEDSVRQVELEVQRAFARVNEARELSASQGKVVEQAEEALRLARERLAAGAGTQLDVLDAQFALTSARTTRQRALYDYNVAIAEFDRATGTDTVYDNTFTDPVVTRNKSKLRPGAAELRED